MLSLQELQTPNINKVRPGCWWRGHLLHHELSRLMQRWVLTILLPGDQASVQTCNIM